MRFFDRQRLRVLQQWFIKYERMLIPGALLLGFITDLLTFRFINFNTALLLLGGHIIMSGAVIAFLDLYGSGYFRSRLFAYLRVVAPLILQYSFGAMLSASVIFYSHSGSLLASWPFVAVLLFLMVANELLRKYYTEPIAQFGVYFFAVFSIMLLILPYVLRNIGPWLFISAGLISLAAVVGLIKLLLGRVPAIRRDLFKIVVTMVAILVVMNLFYFTDLIPPFPLAIREVGVYHQVERTEDGNYSVLAETREDIFPWRRESITDLGPGEPVYFFSAVFAPARMETTIVHRWKYYDRQANRWIDESTIPFTITGGRERGFRGYTWKRNVWPGLWRVNVETANGQVIGRLTFEITEAKEEGVSLEQRIIE